MLADVSGDEVEAWLISQGLITPKNVEVRVPTDRGCSDEEHAAQAAAQGQSIRFLRE